MIDRRGTSISRRGLLLALGGTALTATMAPGAGFAATITTLTATRHTIEVMGRPGEMLGILRSDGRQGLEISASEGFHVRLENRLDEPTTVHWHGLTPPSDQDGVPDLSQPPIEAGTGYDYSFTLNRTGTFWMHSHFGLQEQRMKAPLIVTGTADRRIDEQPVIVMLSDFSFRPAEEILDDLRKGGTAMSGPAAKNGTHDMSAMSKAHAGMSAATEMAPDINDVDYDAYIANDRTLGDPEIVRVEPGGRVRLRIINGAAATNFHVDLGRLSGELIAVDGDTIIPLMGSRFELATAQRVDLRLTLPSGAGAYPVLALREGARERAGIILATAGARIARLDARGAAPAPVLGWALERRLRASNPLWARKADRIHDIALTGDMMRYVWGLNGKAYGESDPFIVTAGERVEMILRNRTMMSHPMHLHGHHFQVVAIDGKRFRGAMRDTILVPPARSVTVAFDADNPGRWAFHCHNLYHMQSGMMAEVRYA